MKRKYKAAKFHVYIFLPFSKMNPHLLIHDICNTQFPVKFYFPNYSLNVLDLWYNDLYINRCHLPNGFKTCMCLPLAMINGLVHIWRTRAEHFQDTERTWLIIRWPSDPTIILLQNQHSSIQISINLTYNCNKIRKHRKSYHYISLDMYVVLWNCVSLCSYLPIFGCFNNLHILASLSNFWWSESRMT